jgi:hypothetical protein
MHSNLENRQILWSPCSLSEHCGPTLAHRSQGHQYFAFLCVTLAGRRIGHAEFLWSPFSLSDQSAIQSFMYPFATNSFLRSLRPIVANPRSKIFCGSLFTKPNHQVRPLNASPCADFRLPDHRATTRHNLTKNALIKRLHLNFGGRHNSLRFHRRKN